ncbi:hypothetical protein, partial [Xylanibacter rodentium]|uniref:hypothetical protein n=1 Tax=Xylanibacter rodentium TaxID=2736289 RepID=UPI002594110C
IYLTMISEMNDKFWTPYPTGRVLPEQVLPMFGRLCSLILLTNLYINKANHNYPFSIFNSQLIISNVFADKI